MAEAPVPYTAFILLAHGRSGSTVLTEALRGHGRIRMYGEICHEDPDERDRATAADRRYEDGESGWRYLDAVVYRNRWWADIEAVGFKLFGDHARTGPAASVWDRLIGDRDIRVILLERRNLLRALQSYEVAVRTNEWVLPVGARPDHERVPPIRLDPAATGRFFDAMRQQRDWMRSSFARHPTLQLEYSEDIDRRFDETVQRVFRFLDVSPGSTQPAFQKQSRLPPRQQIANFDELRRHFRGTAYAEFFDDGDC